jgi:hypothetical protein
MPPKLVWTMLDVLTDYFIENYFENCEFSRSNAELDKRHHYQPMKINQHQFKTTPKN